MSMTFYVLKNIRTGKYFAAAPYGGRWSLKVPRFYSKKSLAELTMKRLEDDLQRLGPGSDPEIQGMAEVKIVSLRVSLP